MTSIPAYRTHLTMQEILARWDWDVNDLRDAIVHQGLTPSYFFSGAVWQQVVSESGDRIRLQAQSIKEQLYLVHFRETGTFDGYFDLAARNSDALVTGDVIFEVGGVGVQKGCISLQDVLDRGVVTVTEMERFEERNQLEAQKESASNAKHWPWGDHHTEFLGHLEAAAKRFWVNFDPTDHTTAATNEAVSSWLQSEHKVSMKRADSIASMLRPDDLPTGPRK